MVNLKGIMARFRRVFAFGGIGVAVLVGAQPVLADTELGHTGVVGVHSLRDSSTTNGATCKYDYKPLDDFGKLMRIDVRPPRMRAVSGRTAQTVGWRFTVQRRTQYVGGVSDWARRYTSPEITAITDDMHDAAFSPASVPVITGPILAGGLYQYRVIVMMLWHRHDGSIEGKARHRVDFYHATTDTGVMSTFRYRCSAAWWGVSGYAVHSTR